MQELELKRERPAFAANFVFHLHSHDVKIGRGAVWLLRVGLNPQNDNVKGLRVSWKIVPAVTEAW